MIYAISYFTLSCNRFEITMTTSKNTVHFSVVLLNTICCKTFNFCVV